VALHKAKAASGIEEQAIPWSTQHYMHDPLQEIVLLASTLLAETSKLSIGLNPLFVRVLVFIKKKTVISMLNISNYSK